MSDEIMDDQVNEEAVEDTTEDQLKGDEPHSEEHDVSEEELDEIADTAIAALKVFSSTSMWVKSPSTSTRRRGRAYFGYHGRQPGYPHWPPWQNARRVAVHHFRHHNAHDGLPLPGYRRRRGL